MGQAAWLVETQQWHTFVDDPNSTGFNEYRGVAKSLARPGREQARATEDIDFHIFYL
jgi:hypothetical protein